MTIMAKIGRFAGEGSRYSSLLKITMFSCTLKHLSNFVTIFFCNSNSWFVVAGIMNVYKKAI